MNMKSKYAWSKEGKTHSNRYNTECSIYQSTPALPKTWHNRDLEKENNQNAHNFHRGLKQQQKLGFFDPVKSTEVPHRLRSSANQQELGQFKKNKVKNQPENLKSSQDFFKFRPKLTTEPNQDGFFRSQHLTFGDVTRNGFMTSREFLEEKRVKNQVIDEIIINAKRGLCKSFNEFTISCVPCVNHPDKKAKYRLLSELSDGEEQMFYCSKCAINLLQQNFKIEEIKTDEPYGQDNSLRLQQITKFELRLKSLEERAKIQFEKSYIKADLNSIDEEIMMASNRFDDLVDLLLKIKKEWLTRINSLRLKKQKEEKMRKDEVYDILGHMRDIQHEMKEYKSLKKFAVMKENQFQFITASLNNKITKFEEDLQKTKIPSPCQKIYLQSLDELQIVDKMREEVEEMTVKERREREITFSRRSEPKEKMSEDDFVCDELKRPFRVLFPSDEIDHSLSIENAQQKNSMLNSVRERSAFTMLQ